MKPQLARSAIDRAAHRRGDSQWLHEAWGRARVLVVDPENGHARVAGEPPRLVFL
ncbi:MAG: NAD(+) diphosphatase, partial [Stackebrandtia sp.]